MILKKIIYSILMMIIIFNLGFPNYLSAETMFEDIKGHWAEDQMNFIINKGLINGYQDKTFKPDRNISRAEVAKIIATDLNLNQGKKSFNDTNGHWASEVIGSIANHEIMTGYTDGSFRPDNSITRAEAAAILVRAYKLTGDVDFTFEDTNNHWAKNYVDILIANNIAEGYNDSEFRPDKPLTRAEFLTLLARVLDDSFKITPSGKIFITFKDEETNQLLVKTFFNIFNSEGEVLIEDIANLDEEGYYYVGELPVGEYIIKSISVGYSSYVSTKFELVRGNNFIEVIVKPNAKIQGVVKDAESGYGLSVNISVYDEHDLYVGWGFPESDGTFSIVLNPGKYKLIIDVKEYEYYEQIIELNDHQLITLDIFLQPKRASRD